MIDLDDLEAAARAALPKASGVLEKERDGNWFQVGWIDSDAPRSCSDWRVYANDLDEEVANFAIAASPTAVLELIARLRAYEAIVQSVAAQEPRVVKYAGGNYEACGLCGVAEDENPFNDWVADGMKGERPRGAIAHSESCIYLRAREATR